MKTLQRLAGVAFALLCGMPAASATQSCGGEPGWESVEITASLTRGAHFVAGMGPRAFALDPTEHGWRIAMLDENGLAVPVFAAPMRPVETNPLNIAGWHFRNRDNTGPNTGDVNAPQHLRRFMFGAMASEAMQTGDTASNPNAFRGLGEVKITGLTLSPPEPGARASIEAMTIEACLVWTGGGARLDPIVDADPGVAFASAVAEMKGCGLDTGLYKLSDRMAQGAERGADPMLRPDLDGDGIPDLVIPIRRRSDGARGMAFCLIGDETLLLAGYDGRIGKHFDPAYFGSADWWGIHDGPVYQGVAEGPPPVLRGQAVLLGKEGASSVLLFVDGERRLASYWQGD